MARADVDGSSTMPLTFFQGLAVPLQCVGCIQSPTCTEILWSGFDCRSLQPATGCGCYFFPLQFYRLGEGKGFALPLAPLSFSIVFCCFFFFFSTLRMAVQAFCLSDGEELLSILYSQE